MGLESGTCVKFDDEFGKKFGIKVQNMTGRVSLCGSAVIQVSPVYGDCTAATMYTGMCAPKQFHEMLPKVLAYLSCQGRISVFFSRKVHSNQLDKEIELLRRYHISGLNVQKSNRRSFEAYMVSGLLKITSPYIHYTYDEMAGGCPDEVLKHDHFNRVNFDEINRKYIGVDQ